MSDILPKFITLNETATEWHIPLPPVMSWMARNEDTPIDMVQAIAIYRYFDRRSDNTTVYEFQGVEITDTRLGTVRAERDTLRARLTLTEQALEAAGALMSVMEVPHYTKDEITLLCDFCDKPLNSHASYCALGQREQAYRAAVARLEEVTK